jgi:hypothetical protein
MSTYEALTTEQMKRGRWNQKSSACGMLTDLVDAGASKGLFCLGLAAQ